MGQPLPIHQFMYQIFPGNKGFIFLEILIAVAITSLVFLVLLSIGIQSMLLSQSIERSTKIDSLLREELEAVRSFRDGSVWANSGLGSLNTGSSNPYYPVLDTSVNPARWTLQAGTQTIGEYTRKIIFDKVSRNPSTGQIEDTYNITNDDPDTRKATASVVDGAKTYEVVTYFTNWQTN